MLAIRGIISLIILLLCTLAVAKAQTIVQPNPIYLPIVKNDPTHTPTATATPTPTTPPTPTAIPTVAPTPTLHPRNPDPAAVAIRPYDVPPGFSIDADFAVEGNTVNMYAGGWYSWYRGDGIGYGSAVLKYWNPNAALAGYGRLTQAVFNDDFYDQCDWGTRSPPLRDGATTYAAIQCLKSFYDYTIYFAVYDNILLRFEIAAPQRRAAAALACEKMMALRALAMPEDLTCRTYLRE